MSTQQSFTNPEASKTPPAAMSTNEPIGNGVLPMPAILEMLTPEQGFTGWINVELDGTPRAPSPPREAAAMSRQYLGQLLGNQVSWRK